jgi:nitric oxide reductase activation protein
MGPQQGADDAARNGTIHIEQDVEKARNIERQKKLIADTEKLLSLANELKVDVDKSNKDTLSLDVIRKADEIEKLAHSVKDRMKGT